MGAVSTVAISSRDNTVQQNMHDLMESRFLFF